MSVESAEVVDFVSIERATSDVVLTISDHLDWTDEPGHRQLLEEKINAYLDFIESGQLLQQYPKAKDRRVVIDIVMQYEPVSEARDFLTYTASIVADAGMTLSFRVAPVGRE